MLSILAVQLILLLSLAHGNGIIGSLRGGNRFALPHDCHTGTLDDQRLSRQLLVYGREGQSLLAQSHVAVLYESPDNLLEEVVRHLALVGIGELTIISPRIQDIDKLVTRVQHFRSGCKIQVVRSLSDLGCGVDAAVTVGLTLAESMAVNKYCRARDIKMISCQVTGVSGMVFCDFGAHAVRTSTGLNTDLIPLKSLALVDNRDEYSSSPDAHLILRAEIIEDELMPAGLNESCVLRVGSHNVTCTVSEIVNSRTALLKVDSAQLGVCQTMLLQSAEGSSLQRVENGYMVRHRPLVDVLASPSFESLNSCLSQQEAAEENAILLAIQLACEKMRTVSTRSFEQNSYCEKMNRLIDLTADIATSIRNSQSGIKQQIGFIGRITSRFNELRHKWNMKKKLKRLKYNTLFESHLGSYFHPSETSSSISQCAHLRCPLTSAVIAGIAAQEVGKALSGIDRPASQLLFFESFESVPNRAQTSMRSHGLSARSRAAESDSPVSKIYGPEIMERLKNARVLVVGAGAIGCEILKNLASIHVARRGYSASGGDGAIFIADMDKIEKSNLNRQILFRIEDVGKCKAGIAAKALNDNRIIDTSGVTNVIPIVGKFSADHSLENVNETFWNNIDVVISAVDNVESRVYLDEMCSKYGVYFIDAGTQGCLGSTQVVVPGYTERYSDSLDPESSAIPVCTVKSFPYKVEHCITWARELFNLLYKEEVELLNRILFSFSSHKGQMGDYPDVLYRDLSGMLDGRSYSELEHFSYWIDAITASLHDPLKVANKNGSHITEAAPSIEQDAKLQPFVEYSLRLFFRLFDRDVSDLLKLYSVNEADGKSEVPFWSASKGRVPKPETWPDYVNGYKMSCLRGFVLYSSILKARVSGIDTNYSVVSDILDRIEAINSVASLKLSRPTLLNDTFKTLEEQFVRSILIPQMVQLFDIMSRRNVSCVFEPEVFDKDSTSGQVNFLTAAASIRAHVYGIPIDAGSRNQIREETVSVDESYDESVMIDPLYVRAVSGKIVPALLSTTAVAAGLSSLEMLKIYHSEENDGRQPFPLSWRRLKQKMRLFATSIRSFVPVFVGTNSEVLNQFPIVSVKRNILDGIKFRNSYINLALPSLSFASPVAPPVSTVSTTGEIFSSWDYLKVIDDSKASIDIENLIGLIENRFKVQVNLLLHGDRIMYSSALRDSTSIIHFHPLRARRNRITTINSIFRSMQALVLNSISNSRLSDSHSVPQRVSVSDDLASESALPNHQVNEGGSLPRRNSKNSVIESIREQQSIQPGVGGDFIESRIDQPSFYDLHCSCVDPTTGEEVDIPKIRLFVTGK